MRISPIGVSDNQLIRHIRLRWYSTLRLYIGTSISLLVLRLRYKNKHLSNHFPYAQVHSTNHTRLPQPANRVVELDPTQQALLCAARDCGHTSRNPGAPGTQLDVLA